MKLHIFKAMTKEEAQEYLYEFLAFGQNEGMRILEGNLHFTTDLDFSIGSLPGVLKELVPKLKTVPREADPKVPEFIRNTEDYQKGLFDFDEGSTNVLLAAAYYLGEAFVRNFPHLKWATGNVDYIQANNPVVTGFKFKKELSPILVTENIFSGVISGIRDEDSINTVVEGWSTKFI